MRILQLVSCRGWSSDAYWAARITAELERAGHAVTLVCKDGSDRRVIERARAMGASRIATLRFASGMKPASDVRDLSRLSQWLGETDVVHVHRGKEHWLAHARRVFGCARLASGSARQAEYAGQSGLPRASSGSQLAPAPRAKFTTTSCPRA